MIGRYISPTIFATNSLINEIEKYSYYTTINEIRLLIDKKIAVEFDKSKYTFTRTKSYCLVSELKEMEKY